MVEVKTEQISSPVDKSKVQTYSGKKSIVAIAVSTGGPKALQSVIPLFPADFPLPILIVQHMPPGFTRSLADRLNQSSLINVKEAVDGEIIKSGTAYIAPGGLSYGSCSIK